MEVQIPEINKILQEINGLKEFLKSDKPEISEWLNDEQCWKLKGGMSLSTYRTNRYYQVKGGIPDAYVGGRKVWNKNSVLEWISISDEQLEEYHKKYKTGAKKKNDR